MRGSPVGRDMVLGLCMILSDAMNIILSMRIDLIYRLKLFISLKSVRKRSSNAYFTIFEVALSNFLKVRNKIAFLLEYFYIFIEIFSCVILE